MLSKYKNLKNDKGYIKLIIANVLSTFGTMIDNIAFSWLVYELTGDAVWIAVIFGAAMVPMVALQSLVAVIVERHNKKKIIIATDILGAILMATVMVLYLGNLLNPVLLLIITFVNATIETIRIPAGISFVPLILCEENYAVGTGLSQSASQIASIVGLSLAGVIVSVFGLWAAFFVDAVTFVLSFLIISTIRCKEVKKEVSTDKIKEKGRFIREYKDGFKTFLKAPKVFFVCMVAIFTNLLFVPLNTYSALFIGDYLGFTVDMYSYISIAMTVGMILGGLISGAISAKISCSKIFVIEGLIMVFTYLTWVGATMLSIEIIKAMAIIAVTFIMGVGSGVLSVNVSVAFMKAVPKEYIARIAGIFNSLASLSSPLASGTLAVMSLTFGIDEIFIIFAAMALIYSIIVLIKGKSKLDIEDKSEEKSVINGTQIEETA